MSILALAAQADSHGQVETIAETFGVAWPHLTAQLISFSIVCALLYRFAYRPILQMLDVRRQQIAQGQANADKINAALAAIESERQQVLGAARAEAAQVAAEAREVARTFKAQEAERAVHTGMQIVLKAREAAAQERTRMMADLRREVGTLVVKTTETVAGRILTADDHRRLSEATVRQLQ
jgi:F-type H+-transporting ATPase subunit b